MSLQLRFLCFCYGLSSDDLFSYRSCRNDGDVYSDLLFDEFDIVLSFLGELVIFCEASDIALALP